MTKTQTTTTARDLLAAAIEAKDTATLLAAHALIEAKDSKDEAERMTAAMIADCVETRHNLSDAMDDIYADDDFAGTYHEALLLALAATGTTV